MNSWKLKLEADAKAAGVITPTASVRAPSFFDGDKFAGGYGTTKSYVTDYWTLRERSRQLFTDNLYAKGLIRRLITNEIGPGLNPESTPDDLVLKLSENDLADWSDIIENRFGIWSKDPELCDFYKVDTFGAIQRKARLQALIEGDVLVIMSQNPVTQLPRIQLVSGSRVQSPIGSDYNLRKGHKINHGVELDSLGRVVAHWVSQNDGTSKRIPARGEKSGRRISWLYYGTERKLDDVRGEPLLSIVLQSLREIDRYRDSVQRKAVLNSFLAMFIKKTEEKPGSLPMTSAAVRKGSATVTNDDGQPRTFSMSQFLPGTIIEELQVGEEPVLMGGQGTDVNFGTFEEAIIQGVAWANEIPPEILRLAFSNNYSASQAAINEFKMYLNKFSMDFGEVFCSPIYVDWLLSETLATRIATPGLLESWRDPLKYDTFGAWTSVEWYGSIKPSTDMTKQVKASTALVAEGFSNRAREARALTGTKYRKNVKRLKRENEELAEMLRPLAEFKNEFGPVGEELVNASRDIEEFADNVVEFAQEALKR